MTGLERLQQRLDAVDRLSEAEAKKLLKMVLTTMAGTFDALNDRLEGRP